MNQSSIPPLVIMVALLCPPATKAAFEPVAQSPWQHAGASSFIFPRTPLALVNSPVAVGLLEGAGVAVSASRPFGLRELDRCAAAGSAYFGEGVAAGCALALSGCQRYNEFSAVGSCAVGIVRRALVGFSLAFRRLQISGYGTGSGISADVGAAFSPIDGFYASGAVRGILRSELGESGDPACPRGVDLSLGLCPGEGVTVAVGASRDENLDPEFSVSASFIPYPSITTGASIRTAPLRFSVSLSATVSSLDVGYGYAGHETLPGSHSVSLCWGRCPADPVPLNLAGEGESQAEIPFPLDVNTASSQDIQRIPGIGPAKASAIVTWLENNGPAESIDQLIDVPGIGPAALQLLREYLIVECHDSY